MVSKLKTPDGKWTSRRGKGKESCNWKLELHLGTERKERHLGERLPRWSRKDGKRHRWRGVCRDCALKCLSMESGTSRETGHSMLTQCSTDVSTTEDLAGVVWLEKATLSCGTQMEEVTEDTGTLLIMHQGF